MELPRHAAELPIWTGVWQKRPDYGIALRAVDEVAPELTRWLRLRYMTSLEKSLILKHATFVIEGTESPAAVEATQIVLSELGDIAKAPLLRSTSTGATGTALQAFTSIVAEHPELWADILPNQEPKPVDLRVHYPYALSIREKPARRGGAPVLRSPNIVVPVPTRPLGDISELYNRPCPPHGARPQDDIHKPAVLPAISGYTFRLLAILIHRFGVPILQFEFPHIADADGLLDASFKTLRPDCCGRFCVRIER